MFRTNPLNIILTILVYGYSNIGSTLFHISLLLWSTDTYVFVILSESPSLEIKIVSKLINDFMIVTLHNERTHVKYILKDTSMFILNLKKYIPICCRRLVKVGNLFLFYFYVVFFSLFFFIQFITKQYIYIYVIYSKHRSMSLTSV